MRKPIVGLVTGFVLTIGAMVMGGAPVAHAAVTCSPPAGGVVACTLDTWADLKTTIQSQPAGTTLNITVTADLTADSTITLVAGETVTIASNTGQHVALRDPALAAAALFSVGAAAAATETLNLQDFVLDGNKTVVTNCTAPLIMTAGAAGVTEAVINLRGASALRNNANTLNANSASAIGAIYVGGSDTLNMYDTAQISGNSSVFVGLNGGAYLSAGATMTMNGSSQVSGNSGGCVGGIYASTNATLAMHDDSKVATNTGGQGGGIYGLTGAHITMDGNASVTGNTSTSTTDAWGAGIELLGPKGTTTPGSGSFLTMSGNSSVTGNHSAGLGGGITASSGCVVTIGGSAKVSDNTAKWVGGIYVVTYGTLTIKDNAVISGNVAEGYTGGVDINTGGSLRITDNAQIINNKTTACYDDTALTGMCLGAGGVYINAHLISGNPPTILSSDSVDALIDGNVIISGNTAASNGGGIYIDFYEADAPTDPPVRIAGTVQITNNAAPNGDGGGIYVGVYDDIANPNIRDYTHYARLQVGAGVVFANNSAQAYYLLTDPALIAIHNANVLTHAFTTQPGAGQPFTYGYSNYDINFLQWIVTFDSRGGTPVVKTNPTFLNNAEGVLPVYPSAFAVRPANDPTRSGYTFKGWCVEIPTATSPCVLYDFATPVTSSFTLYADWVPVVTPTPTTPTPPVRTVPVSTPPVSTPAVITPRVQTETGGSVAGPFLPAFAIGFLGVLLGAALLLRRRACRPVAVTARHWA